MNLAKALEIFGLKDLDGLTSGELKVLYKKEANKKHPDKKGNDDSKDFLELQKAYKFLLKKVPEGEAYPGITLSSIKELKVLTKDEILDLYYKDTEDLQTKLVVYEKSFDKQMSAITNIQKEIDKVIESFEERKNELKNELESGVEELEKKYKGGFFKKLFFFMPQMSEDEFWEEYNSQVEQYSKAQKEINLSFFKEIAKVYGDCLNRIRDLLAEKK